MIGIDQYHVRPVGIIQLHDDGLILFILAVVVDIDDDVLCGFAGIKCQRIRLDKIIIHAPTGGRAANHRIVNGVRLTNFGIVEIYL